MNSPGPVVWCGTCTPPAYHPASLEAGGGVGGSRPFVQEEQWRKQEAQARKQWNKAAKQARETAVTIIRAKAPLDPTLSAEKWKKRAKAIIESKQVSYQNWPLQRLLAGDIPEDTLGYLPAPDQHGWRNRDRRPTSLVLLDLDKVPAEQAWHYFDNECGITPLGVYRSAGGNGAHAVFQIDAIIHTSAEARHAYNRLSALCDLTVDSRAAHNQIRYLRPGCWIRRINAPTNVPGHLLRLHECQEVKKKLFRPKQANATRRSPSTKWLADAADRVDIVHEEYMSTIGREWEDKGYYLHKDAERPQLIPVSPMERTQGGFRINSTGQIWHFGGAWGKQLLSPNKHAGRFDRGWSLALIKIFSESRSNAVLLLHRLQRVQAIGGRLPAWEILSLSAKKEIFLSLGWDYRSPGDIRDPSGRKYTSAGEAIEHHKSLTQGGLFPGTLVNKVVLKKYTDLLVSRLRRGREFGYKLARRLMAALSRQFAPSARTTNQKNTNLEHGMQEPDFLEAFSEYHQATGPPRRPRYQPPGRLIPC